MKFSIIIPSYNTCEYILKAISSVESQSYKNYEIIIVDDGSTDDSASVIRRIYKDNSKIIFKEIEHSGVSIVRNYGISISSGNYIVFLDADDYLSLDLLKMLNDEIVNSDYPDLIRYNANVIEEDLRVSDSKKFNTDIKNCIDGRDCLSKLIKEYKDGKFFSPTWLYCIKREYYLKNNFSFEEGKIQEDYGLMPLVIFLANNISFIDYKGYNYYQRKNSIMNNRDNDKRKAYELIDLSNNLYFQFEKIKSKYDFNYKNFYNYLYESTLRKDKYLKNIEKHIFKETLDNSTLGKACNEK